MEKQLRIALIEMVRRAQGVVAAWERGDLAARVNDLEAEAERVVSQFGFTEDELDDTRDTRPADQS